MASSFFGELITTFLKRAKGVAAIVTDAGIADIIDVASVGLPVFCKGSAPVPGPSQMVIADLKGPIRCTDTGGCDRAGTTFPSIKAIFWLAMPMVSLVIPRSMARRSGRQGSR